MTKTKPTHTPGPWNTLARRAQFFREIVSERGEYIAQTPLDLTGEANARLIAAAPDMENALHLMTLRMYGLLNRMGDAVPADVRAECNAALREAYAAMEKADGVHVPFVEAR